MRRFAVSLLAVLALAATAAASAGNATGTQAYAVIDEPVPSEAALLDSLRSALFQAAALARWSLLNRSDARFLPSPLPPIDDVLGAVALVPDSLLAVPEGRSMVTVAFALAPAAAIFSELANYRFEVRDAGGVASLGLNPLRALGFVSAQPSEPTVLVRDDLVLLPLAVALGVAVFVVAVGLTACGVRRQLHRRARGVSFNELVRLERELHEQFEAMQQQQQLALAGDGDESGRAAALSAL